MTASIVRPCNQSDTRECKPYEQAADLAGIDKVAAANATATRLVEMPGVSVDFDYKHHPVFATVVVRRKKK
jgi:hypothetical protein